MPILQLVDDFDRQADREQARREIGWILAGLLVAGAAVATAPWTIGVVERLDAVTASVILVAASAFVFNTRRRRGLGWTATRAVVVAGGVALLTVAALVAGCVASGCVS